MLKMSEVYYEYKTYEASSDDEYVARENHDDTYYESISRKEFILLGSYSKENKDELGSFLKQCYIKAEKLEKKHGNGRIIIEF